MTTTVRRSLFGAPAREVLETLARLTAEDRAHTAEMLQVLGVVGARKLYLPDYSSLYRYCVEVLRMSECSAYLRIYAARLAWRLPVLYDAIADGRLNLTSVRLLGPYLRRENVDELIAAAAGKAKPQLLALLAERFPQPDVPTRLVPLVSASVGVPAEPTSQMSTGPVSESYACQLGPDPVGMTNGLPTASSAPPVAVNEPSAPRTTIEPLSPASMLLVVTLPAATHAKLRKLQDLLAARPGDLVPEILDQALDLLLKKVEHDKFAATDAPRASRGSDDPHYVSAELKRAVYERDQGRCTHKGPNGERCTETRFLHIDHIEPVARGGKSTLENLRLLCSEYNQQAADEVFGKAFMDAKREQASSA